MIPSSFQSALLMMTMIRCHGGVHAARDISAFRLPMRDEDLVSFKVEI